MFNLLRKVKDSRADIDILTHLLFCYLHLVVSLLYNVTVEVPSA